LRAFLFQTNQILVIIVVKRSPIPTATSNYGKALEQIIG